MSPSDARTTEIQPRAPGGRPGLSAEQRLRVLVELSTEYYWELDAEGRFTTILHGDSENREHATSRLLGRARWEIEGSPLEGTWDEHKAVIESRQEFRDFVVERPEQDGSLRYFASSGRPQFDVHGAFLGYAGVTKEVTGEVRERQLHGLDTELTRLFAVDDHENKQQLALEAVCKSQRWASGKYWTFDFARSAATVAARAFPVVDAHPIESPEEKERRRRLSEHLVRMTSRSGKIFWADDLSRFSHGPEQSGAGCAVVIPVTLRGKPIGAIEFRSPRIPPPNHSLKSLLSRLATQFASAYERDYTMRQLRESQERYSSTIELAAIGISHVGLDGKFLHANNALVDMLGYSEHELKEKTVKDISHPNDQHVTDTMVERMTVREIRSFTAEKRYISKSGEIVWVRINSTMKWDKHGNPMYHISTIENVSDRKKAEERVAFLATHDELTRLPSRAFFNETLDRSIRSAKRRGMRHLAILFIDVDRFKIVNDSLGHEAGDTLLREVGARISGCVRGGDCVARHGGDEFIVLLEDMDSPHDASIVAQKIIAAVHEPIVLAGQECHVTVSVGIALFPEHGSEAGVLTRNGDVAMYAAKANGKNCLAVYSPDLAPMSLERLTLEQHLQQALERGEFRIQYQPKVDAQTGNIEGVEALLRWWNHELGTITPAQFIPVAEDTGLIIPIGTWVLRQACEQSVAWLRAGLPRITMSVNLSPRQFSHASLLEDVRDILQQTQMPPELLELEITESMLVSDIERAIKIASMLRGLGIRLAIDDFGTGYSSLVQLKRFPLDTLKIDRSFVRDLPDSKEDKAITEAVIAMGKTLGVTVVAEGVESPAQRDFLARSTCDQLQGFLYGKPAHPDVVAKALASNTRTFRTIALASETRTFPASDCSVSSKVSRATRKA